jgi:hypothetical protein
VRNALYFVVGNMIYVREYLIDVFFNRRGGIDALIDVSEAFHMGYKAGILSRQQIAECIEYIWSGVYQDEHTLRATLMYLATMLDKTNEGFVKSIPHLTDLQQTVLLARLNTLGLETRGMVENNEVV